MRLCTKHIIHKEATEERRKAGTIFEGDVFSYCKVCGNLLLTSLIYDDKDEFLIAVKNLPFDKEDFVLHQDFYSNKDIPVFMAESDEEGRR